MEKIRIDLWTRMQQSDIIVAELPATQNGYRRWVGVYPYKPPPVSFAPKFNDFPPHKYSVLVFELNNDLHDEYFGPEDMLRQERHFANSENELYTIFEKIGLLPSALTYPWRCDYPM